MEVKNEIMIINIEDRAYAEIKEDTEKFRSNGMVIPYLYKVIESGIPISIQSIGASQPKTGHWIDADGDNAICGCCNRLNHLYGTYCKHCGAKMKEGD